MTTINKTQVTAETDKQELFIVREFDAPRELVFKAFSTPEIMVQFHAPVGINMKFNYADYKNGGSYSWTHSDNDGKIFCTFKGVIHEIIFPERIIQTSELEGMPDGGHVVLEALTFEALSGEKTKLTIQTVCRSVADRDAMVEEGFESGLVIIFEQLDELLKSGLKQAR
jgi:uncharacterized protein YndB with AHSA1/START domain